jgi:hypothetical protein
MRWRPAGRGSLPLSDRLARRGSVSTSRVVRSTPTQPSSQLSTHHAPLPVLLILPRARLTADRGTGCRHASSLSFSRSPSQASPSSPQLRSGRKKQAETRGRRRDDTAWAQKRREDKEKRPEATDPAERCALSLSLSLSGDSSRG